MRNESKWEQNVFELGREETQKREIVWETKGEKKERSS